MHTRTTILRLFKDILIYGSGDILLRAAGIITLPIYTRIFSPVQYGVLSLIMTVTALLGSVISLGLENSYALYYFEAKSQRDRQVLTSSLLLFVALWTTAVVVLLIPFTGLFSSWSFSAKQHGILFILGFLSVPLTLVASLCGQSLRNEFKPALFAVLNAVTLSLTIACNLFCVVVLKLGLPGLLAGTLIASAIVLPVRLWTVRNLLRPAFSGAVMRRMLSYGLPLVPMGLAYWVFASSDRFVLGKLSTLGQLGLYAVANNLTNVLAFVNTAVGLAWVPHAVRVNEDHPDSAPAFFGQVATYLLVTFGVVCIGLTAFAPELLTLVAPAEFHGASAAVGPLALGFVAAASTQVTALGISLSKKTQYFAIVSWSAALLNLGLNVLLVPRWGMLASSWATAAAYGFLTVSYLAISQRLLAVQYERRRALTVAALTILFVVVAPLLPDLHLVVGLILKSGYCLLYVLLLFVLQALNGREWSEVMHALSRLGVRGRKVAA